MPRIPDATSLGYSVPRTRTPQFQDRSGQIVGDATQRLAGTVGQVAGALQEREDKFSYAQAKSTLLQADIEARRELENDQDWTTYETRYAEKMSKAREKAAGLIRGNRDRALFDMDAKLDVERGVNEIRGLSKRKEVGWGRSTVDQTLESNRAAGMNAKDEATREQIINASKDVILGAVAKGYYTEDEGTNLFQNYRDNYAVGLIEMQPPDKRIALLNDRNSVAKHLQPDVRAKLLEAAKNENRDLTVRRESQAQEDAIVAKYGTSTAALKAARDITDPEVRDSTVNRIKVRQAEAKQADMEYREAIGEEALAFLNGGGRFFDLPLRIKNGLKPSELNSLRSYAEQVAGGGTRRTNPETLVELSKIAGDDPQQFGDMDILSYRDKLSDGDFEEFVDLQRKIRSGNVDGKASGFMSVSQVRNERLAELFKSANPRVDEPERIKQERRRFTEKFETQLRSFKSATGKNATADDARKILDDMTSEIVIERPFWLDTSKRAYEITIDDIPDADGREIVAELTKRGKPITEQAIVDLYNQVNRK